MDLSSGEESLAYAQVIPLKTVTVPPYTTTNAIVYGNQVFAVIDPGSPDVDDLSTLNHHIAQRIQSGHRCRGIFLTHHHGDHTKGACHLRDQFSLPIIAHKNACRHLNFSLDEMIDDDSCFVLDNTVSIKALYTPGHADDHVTYFDEQRGCVMAGDMITDRGTVLIPPLEGNLALYLESLDRLAALPIKSIIPAHGNCITKNPKSFLLLAMKHRYERIYAIFLTLAKESTYKDATDITMMVYGSTIADNQIFFAQLSTESSLQWLKNIGLAELVDYKWRCTNRDPEGRVIADTIQAIDQRLKSILPN